MHFKGREWGKHMKNSLKKPISLLLALMIVVSVFTAVPVSTATAATKTDTLTASGLGLGGSYVNWSDKQFISDAVYAGNAMKYSTNNNSAIQLRSNYNNSGIVTTTSGGKVKKITVTWNSNTAPGRTLNIFGKNTAYSAATDLYSSSAQGDPLGTIVYGTSTELTVSGDYAYIGMRSNSSAMYIDTIEIEWDDGTSSDPTEPTDPPTYTVTWVDDDGTTVLNQQSGLSSGASISYGGSTPSKAATAQYTYAFDCWSNGADTYPLDGPFPAVSGNTTYTAHYDSTVNTYTVTWKDENGTTLETDSDVPYGTTPSFDGEYPEKADTAEYTYTFAGWNDGTSDYSADALPAVSGDVTYTAVYDGVPKNTDVLTASDFAATSNSYKSFSDVSKVTGAIYAGNTAKNSSGAIQLRHGRGNNNSNPNSGIISTGSAGRVARVSVIWNTATPPSKTLNIYATNTAYTGVDDLYSALPIGSITYDGSTAVGSLDISAIGNYAYIGLKPASSTTLYLDEIRISWLPGLKYTVTWQNYDGTPLETDEEVASGATPSYDGETPTKPADAQYTYTHSGWTDGTNTYSLSETLPPVSEDITYTATYSSTVNTYTVTWVDEDGVSVLETDSDVPYGTTPTFDGATPTKDSDEDYNYYFNTWSPEISAVTGDVTYTAVYTAVEIVRYTVTWQNFDGTPLETDTRVERNTPASYDGSEPLKASDGLYSYEFYGWTDGENRYLPADLPAVRDNLTFTALYSATPLYHAGRIIRTNDGTSYPLGGKWYLPYGSSTPQTFSGDVAFDDEDVADSGVLYLGDIEFEVTAPTEGTFAHTVYVTGEGTEADPFVIYPNFIYQKDASKISDCINNDISDIHPGDGFKGKSKIRIGTAYIRFLQYIDQPDLECAHGTNGFMGISETHYGNRYQNADAFPYPFIQGDTIYYLGEFDDAFNFSEDLILDNEFGSVTELYTVTWANWDGSVIRTNQVYEGLRPSYGTIAGSTPTRPDDDYRYTFSGWTDGMNTYAPDDELPVMTGDITYTATYSRVLLPEYTITWYDADLNELDTETYRLDQKPSYKGAAPASFLSADGKTRYVFNHMWKDFDDFSLIYEEGRLPAVTGNKSYIACYTAVPIYTVMWLDDDENTELATTDHDSGAVPVYPNETPTKASTYDYSYTFYGWKDDATQTVYTGELPPLTGDAIYIAQYTETPIPHDTYYVVWYNYDGTMLADGDYPADEVPVYPNEDPSKPADAEGHTFVFNGWSPTPTALTEDTMFTAQYLSNFTILWEDGNGEELTVSSDTCLENTRPVYDGATPTKDPDGTYQYVFNGKWRDKYGYEYLPSEIPEAFEDQIYTACFDQVKIHPVVSWYNYDETELVADETYNAYDVPSYKGATPTKPADEDNTYVFNHSWRDYMTGVTYEDTNMPQLTDDRIFVAQFDTVPIPEYTVTWKNYNNAELRSAILKEGSIPYYSGTPIRLDDETYRYTFIGWHDGERFIDKDDIISGAFPAATKDITYTAQYDREEIPYWTITWNNYDGSLITTTTCKDREYPVYSGETPTKPADDEYTYTFAGWIWNDIEYAIGEQLPQAITDRTFTAYFTAAPIVVDKTGIVPVGDWEVYSVEGKYYYDPDDDSITSFRYDGYFEEDSGYVTLSGFNVAKINETSVDTFADTVYVSGSGTYEDPYRFTANYSHFNSSASTVNGATWSGLSTSVPGDSFRGYMCIRTDSKTVQFGDDAENARTAANNYIGISRTEYGYGYSGANITGLPKYTFASGNDRLYYQGYDETADKYTFAETNVNRHPDFVSETPEPGIYTVTWVDWDDRVLETDENVPEGTTPSYDGETPTRETDSNYSYTFSGWFPHLQVVKFDITYKAQYARTALDPSAPIEDIENIFPTDDGTNYDLSHMYYLYGGEVLPFDGMSAFETVGDTLTLGGKTVADIGLTFTDDTWHAEFVNTVFVEGTGSHSDPFIFHPNYRFSGTKTTISNGCSVALKEEYMQGSSKITNVSYPGD